MGDCASTRKPFKTFGSVLIKPKPVNVPKIFKEDSINWILGSLVPHRTSSDQIHEVGVFVSYSFKSTLSFRIAGSTPKKGKVAEPGLRSVA